MENLARMFGIGVLACFALALPGFAQQSSDYLGIVDPIIVDAEQVLQDLLNDKAMIRGLQEKIRVLEADTHSSAEILQSQKSILETYQYRVEALQSRYGTLMVLAERLKREADIAKTIAAIAVPTGIVAIVVAVVEAIALSQK